MSLFLKTTIVAFMILLGNIFMPSVNACSVPVFRWALERWPADYYELVVFREKPLSEEDQSVLHTLVQRVKDVKTPANLDVREIDVTQPIDEPYGTTWKQAQGRPLPVCFLMYPRNTHISTPVWSGQLGELRLDTLINSPVRRELAQRLLGGQSGVWLFLRSGDQAKDDATERLLSEKVTDANKTLQLPDLTQDDTLEGSDPPDISNLRVEFSVLTLNRDDPAEVMLVQMLLGSEPDLHDYHDPMVFPVYGRGRVLYALVGQGIKPETVMKACAFLVGECACEIKAQNPGTDLLLPVDWEKSIGNSAVVRVNELPPLPGTALPMSVDLINTAKHESNADDSNGKVSFIGNTMLVILVAVVLVATGTLVRLVRRRNLP